MADRRVPHSTKFLKGLQLRSKKIKSVLMNNSNFIKDMTVEEDIIEANLHNFILMSPEGMGTCFKVFYQDEIDPFYVICYHCLPKDHSTIYA